MARIKHVTCTSTVSSVDDAFSALEELGSECREIVDNASEGLQQTSRIQTFDETAGTLEGLSQPDVPSCIADLGITYSEQTSKRGLGRARRCQNAVSILQAAADAAQAWLDERPEIDELESDPNPEGEEGEEKDYTNEDRDEVETFISDLESLISDAENCEFPGMYG